MVSWACRWQTCAYAGQRKEVQDRVGGWLVKTPTASGPGTAGRATGRSTCCPNHRVFDHLDRSTYRREETLVGDLRSSKSTVLT